MCSCSEMIGTSGSSAADSARYGINAKVTMAATAGYRPARGPWRISCDRRCRSDRVFAALRSGCSSTGSGQARVATTPSEPPVFPSLSIKLSNCRSRSNGPVGVSFIPNVFRPARTLTRRPLHCGATSASAAVSACPPFRCPPGQSDDPSETTGASTGPAAEYPTPLGQTPLRVFLEAKEPAVGD